MRKAENKVVRLLVAGAVTAVLAPVSLSFAAAWTVPTNARVVQKGTQDTTGRIYNTILEVVCL